MKINELVQENDMSSFLKDLQKNNPKFKNLRIHGDPEHDELRRQDAEKRETDRASAHQKSQDAEAQDHADLPHLEAEYAKMKKEYEALGGSDWQYADREQNLSAGERKARSMESGLHHLANRIRRAKKHGEQGVAGEITAGDMARSAHMQGFKIGREGSGNNMDRAKAQHGENFKHYNAGFLKGRNEKAKSLKAFGQGYNKKRPQPVAEGFNGEYDDEKEASFTEARTSVAVRLGRAIERTQGKTAASQARSIIPSSIPKKEEPKKDEKKVDEGIQAGDGFIIECGDSAIETVVLGHYNDGILIEFDHTATFMLTDAGITLTEAEYQGRTVPLGKRMAGDVKKSKVYVKKPNGNVVKVNFGDKNMTIKKHLPKHRKSYRARHHCENPGPKWKANYWSCRAW